MQKLWALGDADGSGEPREPGSLACSIPLHEETLGLPVEVQFGPGDKRPLIFLAARSNHPLAEEQRTGMDEETYHRVLKAVNS